jgi:cytochrome P450
MQGRLATGASLGAIAEERKPRKLLVLFPGRGGLFGGVGQGLYAKEPAFREMIRHCHNVAGARFPVINYFEGQQLNGETHIELLHASILHAVLHLGLSELWRSKGLIVDGTIGSSLGELTACYLNASLSVEDILSFLCSDVGGHERLPKKAKYIIVQHGCGDYKALVRHAPVELALCAEWSPSVCILACLPEEVVGALPFLEEKALSYHVYSGEYAYHTPLFALCRSNIPKTNMTPRPAVCEVYSSFSGNRVSPGVSFGDLYWFWQGASPVVFRSALESALDYSYDTILCMASSESVKGNVLETAENRNKEIMFLDSLCEGEAEEEVFNNTLETLKGFGKIEQTTRRTTMISNSKECEFADLQIAQDPYSVYRSMREIGSVHYSTVADCWILLDYSDISSVLKQAQAVAPTSGATAPGRDLIRKTLASAFSAKGLAHIHKYLQETSRMLLETAREKGEFDIVGEFALPLTQLTLGRVLNLTAEEVCILQHQCDSQKKALFFDHASKLQTEKITVDDVADFLEELWTDATSIIGGLTSGATNILLEHKAVRRELQWELDLIPQFIEEVLRFDSPQQILVRQSQHSIELANDVIPAGAQIRLCIGAANRDNKHYANPDLFALERNPRDHLSFAAGEHYFLGALLARMQAQVAMEVLLAILPDMEKVSRAMQYSTSSTYRLLEELVVRTG